MKLPKWMPNTIAAWSVALLTLVAAILVWGIVILHKDVEIARESGARNTRILQLVEDCVVEGNCGPEGSESDTQALVLGIIVRLECLAGEETPETFRACVDNGIKQIQNPRTQTPNPANPN